MGARGPQARKHRQTYKPVGTLTVDQEAFLIAGPCQPFNPYGKAKPYSAEQRAEWPDIHAAMKPDWKKHKAALMKKAAPRKPWAWFVYELGVWPPASQDERDALVADLQRAEAEAENGGW